MAQLGRNNFLVKQTLKVEKVVFELEEGQTEPDYCFICEMSGKAKDIYEQSMLVQKKDKDGKISLETDMHDHRAKLAVATLCDEKGKLIMFPEDYKLLNASISITRLQTIVDAANKLNKLTIEEKDEEEKNSEVAQPDNSISDSVEN